MSSQPPGDAEIAGSPHHNLYPASRPCIRSPSVHPGSLLLSVCGLTITSLSPRPAPLPSGLQWNLCSKTPAQQMLPTPGTRTQALGRHGRKPPIAYSLFSVQRPSSFLDGLFLPLPDDVFIYSLLPSSYLSLLMTSPHASL